MVAMAVRTALGVTEVPIVVSRVVVLAQLDPEAVVVDTGGQGALVVSVLAAPAGRVLLAKV